ncbi:MAG: pyridoxamine 5'-phosphate oxidase family protein [Propionibacteriaceae bacterium]|jgi:nitroimidazol reductase NimA-like FMN-containing flavoprotein (pyridoxamine 5'-phosphate oxidase superfamily)|nr:pyridoxamine 5'-phosphate oxidase family protein [Propionibacteriaceae bacterium]
MTDNDSPVMFLETAKGWDLLAGERLGRLAVLADAGIEIFPINYVVQGETLVFRTADGTKLSALTNHAEVTFEIDQWDEMTGHSVVVRGVAAPITDEEEITQVEHLGLKPWVPTVKTTFVRIDVTELSARKFFFGLDPIDKYR